MVEIELGQLWRDKDKGLRLAKVVDFSPMEGGRWTMEWVEHPNAVEVGREWPARATTNFLNDDYRLEAPVAEISVGETWTSKGQAPIVGVIKYVGKDYLVVETGDDDREYWIYLQDFLVRYVKIEPWFEVGKTYRKKPHPEDEFTVKAIIENAKGEKYAVGLDGEGCLDWNLDFNIWEEV